MSNIVDYSIETLLKKGGKVTGAIGFPWDPKKYTNACKFCANFGNHVDGSKGCLRPYCGTDCYVWVTMPDGEVIGACDNFEVLTNSSRNSMKLKCTTLLFIEKARKVHGDFYDYSKVNYLGNKVKVTIICPIHGEFLLTPSDHLSGRGCRKCSYELRGMNSRISLEEFEKRAHAKWGSRFEYGKYVGMHSYIEVTCPKHGIFLVTPHNHLMGCGCPICLETSGESFVRKYLEDNKYFYKSLVRIILPKTINGISVMILDFVVFANDKKYIIEYNGVQHYQYIPFFHSGGIVDFNKLQTRDNLLRTLCKRSNIKLIEIDYRLSDEQVINFLNRELNEVQEKVKESRTSTSLVGQARSEV